MKKISILLFIFLLAFSIRAVYVINNPRDIEGDEKTYDRLAIGLMAQEGYVSPEGIPTSHRPPLYPALLAFLYMLFGYNHFVIRIIQTIFGSFTVCLFYLIAEKIFNKPTALLAGIISSFYMISVFYTNFLLTETFFTFLLALIIFAIISIEKPGLLGFSALGLLCGFLTLLRTTGFFMPLIACIALWLKMKKEYPFLKKIAPSFITLLVCFGFVLLPWTVRNYRAHKKFVCVSTNGGLNMYQAIRPRDGKIFELGPKDEVAQIANTISNEQERSDFYFRAALAAYREDPPRALKLAVMRFLFFWNVIDWNVTDGNVINYHYIFIMPFAILGAIFSFKNRKEILILPLVVLYFTSLVLVFQGFARFRVPIDGYLIILGAYGIYGVIKRQKNKIYSYLSVGCYFLCTYFLYKYSLQTKHFIKTLMEKMGVWW